MQNEIVSNMLHSTLTTTPFFTNDRMNAIVSRVEEVIMPPNIRNFRL